MPTTAWLVQQRAPVYLNVMDYGATGNGIADDTAAINAAITAASAAGGVVFLPPGTFKISSPLSILSPGVTIQGSGVDITIINQVTNNIDGIIIGNGQVTPFTQLNNIVLRDFSVNMPNTSTGIGIHVTSMGEGGHFDNVKVSQATSGFLLEDIDRCVFRNCEAFNYVGYGFVLRQGRSNTWGTATFINCAAVSNTINSVCLHADNDAVTQPSPNKLDRVTFINCHFFANPGLSGSVGTLWDVGCTATTFIGCLWENTLRHNQFNAECDCSFIGCTMLNNNFGSTPTDNGFYINSFAQISVYDCNFQQMTNLFNGASGFPRLCLNGLNKNDGNITNLFTGGFSSQQGTDTVFAGNGSLGAGTGGQPYGHIYGNLFVGGGIALTVASKTGAYTPVGADNLILCNATGGAFTITLPNANSQTGQRYIIKKTDSSANVVTVGTTSSQTIDGATTKSLATQYASIDVISDGANWWIV